MIDDLRIGTHEGIFVQGITLCYRIERQQKIYLFQSNTTILYLRYWLPVSVTRPSSGHLYIKFKTGYRQCTLNSM